MGSVRQVLRAGGVAFVSMTGCGSADMPGTEPLRSTASARSAPDASTLPSASVPSASSASAASASFPLACDGLASIAADMSNVPDQPVQASLRGATFTANNFALLVGTFAGELEFKFSRAPTPPKTPCFSPEDTASANLTLRGAPDDLLSLKDDRPILLEEPWHAWYFFTDETHSKVSVNPEFYGRIRVDAVEIPEAPGERVADAPIGVVRGKIALCYVGHDGAPNDWAAGTFAAPICSRR